MNFNHSFRFSWLIQLCAGIGLFSVSFVIESQIMQAFMNQTILLLMSF